VVPPSASIDALDVGGLGFDLAFAALMGEWKGEDRFICPPSCENR
jgi:hypothetical protein